MVPLRTLPREEWRAFFDGMASVLTGKRAEIEVAALEIGDQILNDWVPLLGITYDSRDDLLDVTLENATHLIFHPRGVVIEEGPGGLASVAVHTEDDTTQVIRLKDPLMLPGEVGADVRAQPSRAPGTRPR